MFIASTAGIIIRNLKMEHGVVQPAGLEEVITGTGAAK